MYKRQAEDRAAAAEAAAEAARGDLAALNEEHEELLMCLAEQDAINSELQAEVDAARGGATPRTAAPVARFEPAQAAVATPASHVRSFI